MAKKPYFSTCPRCGCKSFEHLSDYAHCVNCLHYEDGFEDSETRYHRAAQIARENGIVEEEISPTEETAELAS